MDTGLFAAACGFADVEPIGGLVRRAAVALGLHEGFKQDGLEAIALLPVIGQLAVDDGQNLGGQAFALDPRPR